MLANNITVIVLMIIIALLTWILIRTNRYVFKKISAVRQGLYLRFFEKLINAIITVTGIVICLSFFFGTHAIWKTVLGGTAFVSAVLVFAAQDAIKDILSGLMIPSPCS